MEFRSLSIFIMCIICDVGTVLSFLTVAVFFFPVLNLDIFCSLMSAWIDLIVYRTG